MLSRRFARGCSYVRPTPSSMDGYILLACFVLSELLKFTSGHAIATPIPLPAGFKMDVKYQSFLIKDVWSCTLTGSLGSHGQENQLYINCHSADINSTKFYDFVKDVLLEENGKTGELKFLKGIPEAEKEDPHFPVAFTTEGNNKVFEKPFSLLRLGENAKEPAKEASVGVANHEAAITVNMQGESYQCSKQVIYTNKSAVSPYCDGRTQTRVPCPVIPEHVRWDCGPKKTIHYSVTHYEEQYDHSIIETYLEKLKMKNITLDPIPTLAPSPGSPSAGLSPGTMAPVMITSAVIIAVCLTYFVKRWQSRSTKPVSPSSPGASDVERPVSPAPTSNFSDASDRNSFGAVQMYPAENGGIAVRFHPQSMHCHQDDIGSSGDDTESQEYSQPEESLLIPGNCEERQGLDGQTSDASSGRHPPRVLRAGNRDIRGGEQMELTKEFPDNTSRIHSQRGPQSGQTLLVSIPPERANYSKLRESHGTERSFGEKGGGETPKKRAKSYKEQDSSPADAASAQVPLLGKGHAVTPCHREARTSQVGQP